jgi:membrane-bound lytic murein transglycosylase B
MARGFKGLMHKITFICRLALVSLVSSQSAPASTVESENYAGHEQATQFIDYMVTRHQMSRDDLESLLGNAKRRQSILDAISRPAEGKPWYEYRPIFLTQSRIEGGIEYWNDNEAVLDKASRHFGVDKRAIVAIIGVETRYGNNTGRYRVLDALATLAFDYPPRSKFFRGELEQFLLLAREEDVDPRDALGSYAGAMGYGQFIPSSYRRYAVDFDKNGKRDLWNSAWDIIGSIANYLHVHGWEPGQPVAVPAEVSGNTYRKLVSKDFKPKLTVAEMRKEGVIPQQPVGNKLRGALIELEGKDGPEYWIVFKNFYVITRYNRSPLYAMAVNQLGEEISSQRGYMEEEE